MDKRDLRKQYLSQRKQQPPELLAAWSREIAAHLETTVEFQQAQMVMTYLSAHGEVETLKLVKKLLAAGRSVCVPLCDVRTHTMTAHRIDRLEQLHPGSFGILEPAEENAVSVEDIDFIVVPGCVFSRDKHRIGYGKGYYDKFLSLPQRRAVTAGLAYGFCLLDGFETDIYDVKLDMVVTETGVLR